MKIILATLLATLALLPIATAQNVLLNPSGNQTVTQPSGTTLDINYLAANYINGVPQADQFAGGDFCVKLSAAITAASTNHYDLVDATHFSNTQSCSVNPFASLGAAYSTYNLTVLLPAAFITTTVPIVIENSGISVIGMGRGNTVFYYNGASKPYVFALLGTSTNYVQQIILRDFSVISNGTNATDGLYMENAHRSTIEDLSAWGVSGCGIHTAGAVTDTFIKDHVSGQDAQTYGWTGGAPGTGGFCFGQIGTYLTTDGTVIDSTAENITGACGWVLTAAWQMTFTGGSSEENKCGISIAAGSKYNTFINSDLEGNTQGSTGVDVNDQGQQTNYIGIMATSSCSSCQSMTLGTGGNQFILNGDIGTGVAGPGANYWIPGNLSTTATSGSDSLPANPAGFMIMTVRGAAVKVPYYNN